MVQTSYGIGTVIESNPKTVTVDLESMKNKVSLNPGLVKILKRKNDGKDIPLHREVKTPQSDDSGIVLMTSTPKDRQRREVIVVCLDTF